MDDAQINKEVSSIFLGMVTTNNTFLGRPDIVNMEIYHHLPLLLGGAITILKKYDIVNGKDDNPHIIENKKCSKPPTSLYINPSLHVTLGQLSLQNHPATANRNFHTDPAKQQPGSLYEASSLHEISGTKGVT